MNCHRARQLISPYLDDQLTGQQMLALQRHFSECASCEAERQSIQQVKRLLRCLHQPQPRADFPQAVAAHARQNGTWQTLWADLCREWFPLPARPQRGRRLATSLALSCLTVLTAAAPFAPASQDRALSASGFLLPGALRGGGADAPAQPGLTAFTALPPADVRPDGLLVLTDSDEARRERVFAAQYAQPALSAAPGGDDAVPSYVQGDVALADYRTR